MTPDLVVLAALCSLATVSTELTPTSDGWREEVDLEWVSDGGCHRLNFVLPPAAEIAVDRARIEFGDGPKGKIPSERWQWHPRAMDGTGTVTLHVPELLQGDRVRVSLTRTWHTTAPLRWRPGADGAHWAELKLNGVGHWLPQGEWQVESKRDQVWAAAPKPTDEVWIFREAEASRRSATIPDDVTGGLSAQEAWAAMSQHTLIPRAVDGDEPMVGQTALERGAVDDRGFAWTLLALAQGGPDRVEPGWWVSDSGRSLEDEGAVALWHAPEGPRPLLHPDTASRAGLVASASGETVEVAWHAAGPGGPELEATRLERTIKLDIPGRDPQRSLWPGGGSSAVVEQVFSVESGQPARVVHVPLPREHTDLQVFDPMHDGRHVAQGPGSVWWVTPPSGEVSSTLTVRYVVPDAPVCGEVSAEAASEQVLDPAGLVLWRDQRWWWLSSHGQLPVMPDRERLVAALNNRFRRLSYPEPALPLFLKNHPRNWELVKQLRPLLHERARVDWLPSDPSWPRPLNKARKSRVTTSIEAALILQLQLGQARIPADWVLVRPAEQGPGHPFCPASYSEGLVRVGLEEQIRWIDPGCTVCAPFELRPHLEGASALGRAVDRSPAPTSGRLESHREDDRITWQFTGPPALLLRIDLAEEAEEHRQQVLAERLGGAAATLVEVEGLSEAGAAVTIVAENPSGPSGPDILRPSNAQGWWTWVGERVQSRATTPEDVSHAMERPAFSYRRSVEDGRLREELHVKQRQWSQADLDALSEARSAGN